MSNTKKLLSFICLVLLTIVLVGCELPVPQGQFSRTESEARADLNTALGRLNFTTEELTIAKDEITLTKEFALVEQITYTWTSSDEQVIKIEDNGSSYKGVVTRPESEDVQVTLSCVIAVTYTKLDDGTAQKGTVSETKEFTFTVKKLAKVDVMTIADARKQNAGTLVAVEGVVTSIMYNNPYTVNGTENSLRGIFIKDESGSVYVYGPNKFEAQVGDKVLVTAEVGDYYGSCQLTNTEDNPISVKVVESGQSAPAYSSSTNSLSELIKTHNATEGGAGGFYINAYVKIESSVSGSNTNINLVDPITGEKVQLYYRTGFEYLKGVELKSTLVETFAPYEGKYVNLPIVVYYTNSTDTVTPIRVQIAMGELTEAAAPTLSDEDLVNQAEIDVKALAGTYYANDTVALFTEHKTTGCTVSWAASVEGVIDLATGVIAETATPQTVTLTATIAKGKVSRDVTVEIVIAEKLEVITVKEAIELANKGEKVKVCLEGTIEVVYSSYKDFYLKDETGCILVYVTTAYEAGDKVRIIGTTNSFNGTPQISKTDYKEELIEKGTWKMSTPTVVTVADITAYTSSTAPYGAYLQVTGKLVTDGSFLVLADSADSSKTISLYNSNLDEIKPYADTDAEVTLNVYFYGNAKSDWSGAYRVIFVAREGEYKLPVLSADEEVKQILEGIKVDAVATENFELPVVEGVVWSMKEASEAATLEGNAVTVVRGAQDVTVVFVATATVGEATATKEFSVVVKGTESVAEKTVVLTPETFTTYEYLVLNGVVENTSHPEEFTFNGSASILSTKISGVTKVVAEVYGTYDNMKMYAGTSESGTLVTATTASITSGVEYTYTFAAGTNEFYFVNSSTYKVHMYSITIYYTGEVSQVTEQDRLELDIAEIELPTTLAADSKFPVALSHGSTVVYTSSNPEVLSVAADGTVTVVRASEEVQVTVSYVVTLGEAKSEGHQAVITVPAAPSAEPTEVSLTGDFMCTSKGSKVAPEGWKLNVGKGSYDTLWQSFRNNGEYALSPLFAEQTSVNVSFTWYLNNTGTSGNLSSKIKFEALDASGAVVSTFESDELNGATIGVDNASTITATLEGAGIVQVKVSFVKAGGGNVAFSTITINTTK